MKKILVWISIVTLIFAGVFAMNACQKTGDDGATYALNLDNFDNITAFGEDLDLSRITIVKTENGVSTEIALDDTMVSTIDTSKIGARVLKINYAGQTFSVPVVVKYRIQYLVDDVAYNTQYVLNSSELEAVEAPEKDGYVFAGWSAEIPEIITENVTLSANYTPYIPELTGITATYGDKLSGVQLPYTVVGSWQFDSLENETFDAAGKQKFAVSFVLYETGEAIEHATLALDVAKKEVVFSNVVDSFIYNGKEQYPVFDMDIELGEENLIFYSNGDSNYTDAGVYEYYYEIDHENYKGELIGTYEIKPAVVTVKIESYTIDLGDVFPKIEYVVEGFDLEQLSLLGISVTKPETVANGVGTYTLTATASNPNIELVVEEGTLVINNTELVISDPVLLNPVATYGDLLNSIEFETNPNGRWIWETPDQPVGDKGVHTYTVIFVPYDNRYESVYRTVDVTVEAKKLDFIVTNLTFTYNGEDQALEYIVVDKQDNNKVYDLVVLGNDPFKNAGTYSRTLTLEDTNYEAIYVANQIIVNKAIPETDFSQVFTATWSTSLRLSDFQLPEGYAWVDEATTKLPGAGKFDTYQAIYTPADTENFETVTDIFVIEVAKAAASINNVENSYDVVYNGNAFAFDEVTYSYNGAAPVFSYKLQGATEDLAGLPTNAGTYTVTIALPETDNYLAAESVTTTVTIAKADNADYVLTTQSEGFTYGDSASKIILPTSTLGTWALEGNPTTVGNAGTNTFVAIFTPADADNYNGREVEITVVVAKKAVNAPTISALNKVQVYTGETLTSGLIGAEGYVITDNGGVNVGSYTATIALSGDNYIWSDGTLESKNETYTIVVATNQWTVEPTIGSWVYGQAGDLGSATAMVGQVTIEYKLADAEDSAYSTTLPTNAGNYVARFTATDSNYAPISVTREFTISKKEIDVPVISADKLLQIYTGSALNSGLVAADEYTVTDNGGTNANTYTAIVSLKDKANYKWTGSDSNDISLSYTIAKAQVVISNFAINGWTYGDSANAPVATTNFGTVSYVYATTADGEYTASVPTGAGTYYVKAVVAGNENLIGATSDPISFTIAKASVTINGANDTYSKVYNTEELNITGVTASNGAALTVVITKNGEVVDKMINAGEYVVTFSFAGDDNYLAAEKAVVATITPATNTETVIANQNATYGNLASVITLPAGVEGYWSLEGVDATTTVGNAGTNTFVAIFTSTTGNYNSRTETITVTVAKAVVRVPIVEDKEYDEQFHNSGLTNTTDYTIVEDLGGIEHGDYQVVLTLNDPNNYKWATTTEATITIQYVISVAINKWVDAPSIADSWEYESAGDAGHASALHGGVKIEYKPEGADDSAYSTTLPTLPGKYVARFTTLDDNYTLLKVEEHFEITKRKIAAPVQSATQFAYTGNTITSGIAGNEFYSVVDNGATNVGDYVASVTLKSEHYVWADGVETLAREYNYSIVKASIVISDLVLNGWTYGEAANAPTSTNNFGQVVSYVYASAINGEYTEVVPTNAGTYYVKAVAQGNDNLNAGESAPVSFTIAKASASIIGAQDSYTAIYNNSAYTISGVTASNGVALEYVYVKNGETVSQIWNAGVYTVTIVLPETSNYVGASTEVTVTIEKIANTDTIPANYTATYGDKLSTLALPTTTTGTWSWSGITAETTVGNAGTQTHTLVFTPADAENYATRTIDVNVTVYKKLVTTPTVPNTSMVYNATTQYSGLANTALYTVSNDGRVNVGDQVVTLTLVDPANYAWNDKNNTSATVEVTYTITKGTNEITDIVYAENWTYGESMGRFSASALYGDVSISYSANGVDYVALRPTNAGTYTAKFTTTDANCDAVVAIRTFTIAKATVTTPSVVAGESFYSSNLITSGIVDNEFYTVVDAGGVNVGTYTAVIKLKDSTNYKWSTTQDSADIELTYIIKRVSGTITLNTTGWVYGVFQAPVVTVTPDSLSSQVIVEYSADGGNTWSTTPPTEVGVGYLVRAYLPASDNYTVSAAQVEFDITKATPTISGISFEGGKYYKNQFNPTTNGMTAIHNGNAVAGTFTLGTPVFADGTNASYVTVTFTPADTKNYATVTTNVQLTFVSVAYINNSTPYGSIEDALAVAGSGDVVWVRPFDASLGAIYIMSDTTVPTGVTLLLPYGINGDGSHTISNGTISVPTEAQTSTAAPADESLCHVKVVIAAGKTLTNNGTIQIAGQISGGAGAAPYSSFTAGEHARLVLDASAELINNGTIYAAGFIRELVKNNGSKVILNNGSVLYQPFTVKDFPGGSVSYAIYNTMGKSEAITAYNRFFLMNVSPETHINYGGVVNVWALLWANDQINQTMGYMVGAGSNSSAVITLTDPTYSKVVYKYDVDTEIGDLDVYGGARTNGMKFSVKVLTTVTINTADALFAISLHNDIELLKSEGQETATFSLDQRFKIMPGAKFTVGEGVTLNATDLIVYDEFVDIRSDAYGDPNHPMAYPAKPAAIFTVNGTLVVNSFGGNIYSNVEGAKVVIKTATVYTAYEIDTVSGSSFTAKVDKKNPITEKAVLVGATHEVSNIKLGASYTYANGEWMLWNVSFDSNGGSACATMGVADAYLTLPTPTRDGYEFLGWYYNDTLVSSGEAPKVESDHTLTAKWKREGEVWITIGLDSNGDGTADSTTQFNPADGMVYPDLPTPTKDGYKFKGWAYNDTIVTKGSAVTASGDHMLTAQWVQLFTVTVSASNATVTGVTSGDKVAVGDTVSVTVSFSQSKNKSFTVKDASGTTLLSKSANGTYTFTMPASDVTISASSESNTCVTPDTLVTLADGTQKRIDEVQPTDMLLVWNFYEGKYDVAPASILMNHGYDTVKVLTLEFADGTKIGTINGHGFFDEASNEFVIINTENVADFVGHNFVKVDGDGYTTTELVGYSVEERYTEVWSILTVRYYNCILEGLWSVTEAEVSNSPTYLMPFVVGEDMKYDSELMQADIEKYGLYTYEDFAMYCTEEQFEALGLDIFKVAVGKGYITYDQIVFLLQIHCS